MTLRFPIYTPKLKTGDQRPPWGVIEHRGYHCSELSHLVFALVITQRQWPWPCLQWWICWLVSKVCWQLQQSTSFIDRSEILTQSTPHSSFVFFIFFEPIRGRPSPLDWHRHSFEWSSSNFFRQGKPRLVFFCNSLVHLIFLVHPAYPFMSVFCCIWYLHSIEEAGAREGIF